MKEQYKSIEKDMKNRNKLFIILWVAAIFASAILVDVFAFCFLKLKGVI